ncbi:MAG: hypothetical protein JXB10_18450 [Pirellulales bacterium]|nr:hypothetical protein [Pirellulales bacterium]
MLLTPFQRKIAYLIAIGVVVSILYILGRPATPPKGGKRGSRGGLLAQSRERQGLSEAQLGQIDPASATIKWATLGLRGVAAQILWYKANEYKMRGDFINYKAALEQITKVQPHFISVWIHLAWNLSYNVSVEFDDYRDRYRWVIQGIDFLKQGLDANKTEPRLQWELGWIISQKIGVADEHTQFRRLFREDESFHGSRPLARRDNWLVGKEWFDRAADLAQRTGKGVRKKSPLLYLSNGPMCLMNYAAAMEEEGTFGEKAGRAWKHAGVVWRNYGEMDIPSSWGEFLHLNDQEQFEAKAKDYAKQLDDMEPGLRDRIIAEKRAKLDKKQRIALETPFAERTENQMQLAGEAELLLNTTHEEVARRISGPQRGKAKKLAEKAKEYEVLADHIKGYRDIVNFNYWRMRADVEQTSDALDAQKLIYDARQAYRNIDLLKAKKLYEEGLVKWRALLDQFPEYAKHDLVVDDLVDEIKRYERLLQRMDEPFPKPFILQDVVDRKQKK